MFTVISVSIEVVLGMWFAYAGAYPLAFLSAFHIAPAHQVAVFWIGMAIMISGSLLRRHCFRMLGESFTGDVRARPDQHRDRAAAGRTLLQQAAPITVGLRAAGWCHGLDSAADAIAAWRPAVQLGGGSIGLPAAVYTLDAPRNDSTKAKVFTEEVRIAGGTKQFQWVAGGFFDHMKRHYAQDLPVAGFTAVSGAGSGQ